MVYAEATPICLCERSCLFAVSRRTADKVVRDRSCALSRSRKMHGLEPWASALRGYVFPAEPRRGRESAGPGGAGAVLGGPPPPRRPRQSATRRRRRRCRAPPGRRATPVLRAYLKRVSLLALGRPDRGLGATAAGPGSLRWARCEAGPRRGTRSAGVGHGARLIARLHRISPRALPPPMDGLVLGETVGAGQYLSGGLLALRIALARTRCPRGELNERAVTSGTCACTGHARPWDRPRGNGIGLTSSSRDGPRSGISLPRTTRTGRPTACCSRSKRASCRPIHVRGARTTGSSRWVRRRTS